MATRLGVGTGAGSRGGVLRRGVIAGLLVVAAVLGGLVGASRTETSYQSTTVMMVIPPGAGSNVATLNPFVNMTQNLSMLGNALATALNSSAGSVGATPPPSSITGVTVSSVKDDTTQNAQTTSQISIVVQGTDAAATQKYGQEAIKQAARVLHRIQYNAGVRGATFADVVTIAPPSPPQKASGSAMRAAVSAAAVAVVAMAILIAAVLGALTLLRRRRAGRSANGDDAASAESEPSDSEPLADDSVEADEDSTETADDPVEADEDSTEAADDSVDADKDPAEPADDSAEADDEPEGDAADAAETVESADK